VFLQSCFYSLRTFSRKQLSRKERFQESHLSWESISWNGSVTICHSDAATTDYSIAAITFGRWLPWQSMRHTCLWGVTASSRPGLSSPMNGGSCCWVRGCGHIPATTQQWPWAGPATDCVVMVASA